MKDYALIEAFQNGDEFAFVGIYNRYKSGVYAFCLKMLLDSEQAQDVTQETFVRVYENRARLMKTSSFKSWLFTIARNQCLNSIRRSSRHVAMDEEAERKLISPDTPITSMEKNEQIRFITRFLESLKPEYREVIILREYQNLSYEEIAAVTRSSISAIKSRLFKARRKLAVVISDQRARQAENVARASRSSSSQPVEINQTPGQNE